MHVLHALHVVRSGAVDGWIGTMGPWSRTPNCQTPN